MLLITLVAFENMGVGTAMPALIADLGTVSQYGWPFLAFIATNVIGTVLAGRWSDAHGPRAVLLGAPAVFGLGLLVAGTAGTLTQLLIGRVLQGLSAGATGVVVYVLIALIYTPRARPAVFGLISAAWVVPSLVGPPISALVTEQFSWHWVFLGLLPLVVVALLLVLPASRGLPTPTDPPAARPGLVAAAFAAAFGVTALSWSGQHTTAVGLVVALAAAAVLFQALRRLVPAGTFVARPGIAAVVAGRALIAGAFFTAAAYLPLMLTSTHGWSLTAASAPLIVGSLGWSGASAWQGRHPDLSRAMLLRVGFLQLAVGLAALLLVAPSWGLAWLALPAVGRGRDRHGTGLLGAVLPAAAVFRSHRGRLQLLLGAARRPALAGGVRRHRRCPAGPDLDTRGRTHRAGGRPHRADRLWRRDQPEDPASRLRPADLHLGVAAQHEGPPAPRLAGQVQVGVRREQGGQRLRQLHPGERSAQAEVHPGPEGEVRVRVPRRVEDVGIGEDRRVPVGSAEQRGDLLALLDHHSPDLHGCGGRALEELQGRVEAQHLLDGRGRFPAGAQPCARAARPTRCRTRSPTPRGQR